MILSLSTSLSILPESFDGLLVANGEPVRASLLRELAARSSVVVGIDGGANQLHRRALKPDVVVGDLDSIAPATLRWIRRRHIRLQHEREQERSDLEKGLAFARAQGWKRIALVSVLGSRPDHSLFALQLLASTARLDFVVIAKDFIVMPLRGRQSRTFALRHGTALSWLPFARSTGCTLTGVRWPFSARTMTADGFRSLSNEVTGNSVLASQRSGFSWLMISLKT